jgi:hypothetical protein
LTHQIALGKSKLKKSTMLYWSFAISGVVLIALILVGAYLASVDSLSILALLSPTQLGIWFVFGCIVPLTTGTVGIIWHHLKNHRKLFTALAILLIPPLTFFASIFACIIIIPPLSFPMRSEITQVTVVDTSPLVLYVGVKAITSRDSRIDQAFVIDSDNELAAETSFNDREWFEHGNFKGLALAILPAGSEITLTLDFNTTLPSGSYLVRLSSWGDNHGDSTFTIP